MEISTFIFYFLSASILLFGILTVTTRHIFRAAFYLLSTLAVTAGLYFFMAYDFIAVIQIIVYVGGIVVLILFSILLTQEVGVKLPKVNFLSVWPVGIASLVGMIMVYSLLSNHAFTATSNAPIDATIETIGYQLLDITAFGFILPFEVVSILLLAAMIGSIVIAIKD